MIAVRLLWFSSESLNKADFNNRRRMTESVVEKKSESSLISSDDS